MSGRGFARSLGWLVGLLFAARVAVWGFALSMLLALGGCGPPDLADRLARYEEEVSRIVAGSDASPRLAGVESGLPRRRERRVDTPDHRIGGIDFLAIQGCRLSELVGARNGPMGRVMVPTRRLVYEVEVLEAASHCLSDLAPERASRLSALLDRKRSELPAHLFNAVWMGEEMEAYLSSTPRPLAAFAGRDDRGGVREAARVMSRPVRSVADAEALEAALVRMRDEYPAGPLLGALDRTAHHLGRISELLLGRTPTGCRDDTVRLVRAFEGHYLPIQTALARLDRGAFERIEALDAIYRGSTAGLESAPPAMASYRSAWLDPEAPSGTWRRYRGALQRHAAAWTPTLVACGKLPSPEDA